MYLQNFLLTMRYFSLFLVSTLCRRPLHSS